MNTTNTTGPTGKPIGHLTARVVVYDDGKMHVTFDTNIELAAGVTMDRLGYAYGCLAQAITNEAKGVLQEVQNESAGNAIGFAHGYVGGFTGKPIEDTVTSELRTLRRPKGGG